MIKVTISTMVAVREDLPDSLIGLDAYTLQNLQSELNPVPDELAGIEYWPEITVTPDYDPMTEKLEGETLAANAVDKTVTATAIVVTLSAEEQSAIASAYEAEMVKLYGDAVQNHMDKECQTRTYDGILSLCTYATSAVPKFSAEAQIGIDWRDACWAYTYLQLDEVKAGNRAAPTVDELLAELPVVVWPA